jgi:pantoate--beta-alanine ligase
MWLTRGLSGVGVIRSIREVRELKASLGGRVGLVPTMGFLHQGHLQLLDLAMKQNEAVIMSIFVNPTQFGPNEDFGRYPRDLEGDLSKISSLVSKDSPPVFVFAPEASEMYSSEYATFVDLEGINSSDYAEGSSRPGHFRGVATVVTKLFNVTQANRAYFGAKDGMQW